MAKVYKDGYDTEDGLTIEIYTPDMPRDIIYFHGADESIDLPYDILGDTGTACINIMGVDWDNDLTPWPAPGLGRKQPDFGGGADAYLKKLIFEIVPQAEDCLTDLVDVPQLEPWHAEKLPSSLQKAGWPRRRMIGGVSLAGLFSLYACYRTDFFQGAASISGSLWYDKFLDFMGAYKIWQGMTDVYFSVGDKEKNAKNPRLASVETCTEMAQKLLADAGIRTCFERNPGGHFADGEERIRKAFAWLLHAEA